MRSSRSHVRALWLALVLLVPAVRAQEGGEPKPEEKPQAELQLALQKGDELVYVTSTQRTTKVDSPEAASSQLTRQVNETWTVEEAKDGKFTIRIRADRIRDTSTGDSPFEFDSAGKSAEELAKLAKENAEVAPLAGLIGKSYVVHVTATGEIEKIDELDKYFEGVRTALEAGEGDAAKEVAKVLGEAMKPENFKEQLRPVFAFLRSEKTAAGATWTAALTRKVPGAGTIKEEVKFALSEIDAAGMAKGTSETTATFEEAADRPKLFKDIGFEVADVTGKGTFSIDTKSGWIDQTKTDLSWKVRITLSGDPALRIEQSVTETTTTKLETKTRKPAEEKKEEKKEEEKKEEEKKEGGG